MRTARTITLTLLAAAPALLVAGCTLEKPLEVVVKPETPHEITPPASLPSRFQNPTAETPTAVDSAMEISEKYAKLTEEKARLEQENAKLREENKRLADEFTGCKAQLNQAKKELAEANDLLVEMRIELNNWKTNILGFRDEMRDADKAQLEALMKILKVLGGELKDQPGTAQAEAPAADVPGGSEAGTDKPM